MRRAPGPRRRRDRCDGASGRRARRARARTACRRMSPARVRRDRTCTRGDSDRRRRSACRAPRRSSTSGSGCRRSRRRCRSGRAGGVDHRGAVDDRKRTVGGRRGHAFTSEPAFAIENRSATPPLPPKCPIATPVIGSGCTARRSGWNAGNSTRCGLPCMSVSSGRIALSSKSSTACRPGASARDRWDRRSRAAARSDRETSPSPRARSGDRACRT